MTPQELKNSILQLAIQGKLVAQRPEEGTGTELFQQIQEEKKRLIKEGVIKKGKKLPEIAEEEIPFEVPESWMWCQIGSITTLNPKNKLDDKLDVAFIPMSCVSDGYQNTHTFEIRKWKEIKRGFTHFSDGDIGVAKITPCFQNRKSVIFQNLKNGYGAGTTELSIIRILNHTISSKYLLWYFKTEFFISNGVKSFTGTAGQQRINKDYLVKSLFPLPPLAEQKRIVAKIEELQPLIDRYEKAWTKLEDFNQRFPTDMQKSLLQMAIQGKLVAQRPEEGTGSELYQQIQREKKRLIKEGTLKKGKKLPEITEEELPFDIPENWKWCRIGTIFNLQAGKNATAKEITDTLEENSYPCFGGNGQRGFIKKYNRDGYYALIGRQGALCGNINLAKGKFYATEHAVVVETFAKTDTDWSGVFLRALNLNQYATATAQPGLAVNKINQLLIPLPPFAEQRRIVAKLDQILPLCEKLK